MRGKQIMRSQLRIKGITYRMIRSMENICWGEADKYWGLGRSKANKQELVPQLLHRQSESGG